MLHWYWVAPRELLYKCNSITMHTGKYWVSMCICTYYKYIYCLWAESVAELRMDAFNLHWQCVYHSFVRSSCEQMCDNRKPRRSGWTSRRDAPSRRLRHPINCKREKKSKIKVSTLYDRTPTLVYPALTRPYRRHDLDCQYLSSSNWQLCCTRTDRVDVNVWAHWSPDPNARKMWNLVCWHQGSHAFYADTRAAAHPWPNAFRTIHSLHPVVWNMHKMCWRFGNKSKNKSSFEYLPHQFQFPVFETAKWWSRSNLKSIWDCRRQCPQHRSILNEPGRYEFFFLQISTDK